MKSQLIRIAAATTRRCFASILTTATPTRISSFSFVPSAVPSLGPPRRLFLRLSFAFAALGRAASRTTSATATAAAFAPHHCAPSHRRAGLVPRPLLPLNWHPPATAGTRFFNPPTRDYCAGHHPPRCRLRRFSSQLSSSDVDRQDLRRSDLERLTVVQLKSHLRRLGAKVSGRKAELIDRLLELDDDDEEDGRLAGTTGLGASVDYDVKMAGGGSGGRSTARRTSPRRTRQAEEATKDDEPAMKQEAEADSDAASIASYASSSSSSKKNGGSSKKRTATAKKTAKPSAATGKGKDAGAEPKKKKAKKADHQRWTERDDLPKLWDAKKAMEADGSYTFKIISWNVAGLRALMRNHPKALSDLVETHRPDVLCLQETKLQEMHVDDPKLKINGHLLDEEGYDSHYSCSTAKKGYAGTAMFIKRRTKPAEDGQNKGKKKQATLGNFFGGAKKGDGGNDKDGGASSIGDVDATNLIPVDVSDKLGKSEHDAEGRIITAHFPLFTLSNLYVPNSGQKLERLQYRTEQWDADLLESMQRIEKERNHPVIWLGDLNVAHTGMEVWNEGAKHLVKSAGTTPEERASFDRQLNAGYVDAFRALHPNARGQYTYWSQRAGNRGPNKGLRLDYFVCSGALLPDGDGNDAEKKSVVRDSYILPDQVGSDHCPIVLEIEIKK